MKLFLSAMLLLLNFSNCTGQYLVDKLYYNQDALRINQLPLHPELEDLITNEAVNRKDCQHMKCLEGYRIWGLKNDSLFLKNIQNCCGEDLLNNNLLSVFSSKFQKGEYFASWINDTIYNQYGELLYQVYDSQIFEFDRDFEIENGRLLDIENYDNRASQKSNYTSNTDSLYRFLYQNIDWELISVNHCVLDELILINFRVDEIRKPTDLKILRGSNSICDNEMARVIERLPSWDLYFRKGKPIDMTWNLPIRLSELMSWGKEW